jgi:hypothetical protein
MDSGDSILTSSLTFPGSVLQLAGEWFRLDVANGDARLDTLDTYLNHIVGVGGGRTKVTT